MTRKILACLFVALAVCAPARAGESAGKAKDVNNSEVMPGTSTQQKLIALRTDKTLEGFYYNFNKPDVMLWAPSREELATLRNDKTLRSLYITGRTYDGKHNEINGTKKSENRFEVLSELTQLRSLTLDHVYTSDQTAEYILNLKNLESLSLIIGSEISDQGLFRLSQLPKLKSLNLDCDNITADGIEHLSKMKLLDELSLLGECLKDANVEVISKLEGVSRLHLSGADISEKGLIYLSKMPKLAKLFLSSNVSDEKIERCFSKRSDVKIIYTFVGNSSD